MSRIICALILAFASLAATAARPLALADDAPERYEVRRGDTLWSIAGHFLREPWRWPEVWRLNREQIANPHRIYPGDVVLLDRSAGQPRLSLRQRLEPRVWAESLREPVPTVPMAAIAPFLSRPMFTAGAEPPAGARIVATQEDRVLLGPGQRAYAAGLTTDVGVWTAYRRGEPVVDVETGRTLGYHSVPVGTLRTLRGGSPAVLEVVEASQEIGKGDRLVPAKAEEPLAIAPHAPDKAVSGSVVAIPGAVGSAGARSVVAINRGSTDGIEVGHVLAVARRGAAAAGIDGAPLPLPPERYGTLLVFRCFAHVSYALVLDATRQVDVGDRVETP